MANIVAMLVTQSPQSFVSEVLVATGAKALTPSPSELAEVVVCMQPAPAQPLGARKQAENRMALPFEIGIAKTRNERHRALPVRFEVIQWPIQPALVDLGTGRHIL